VFTAYVSVLSISHSDLFIRRIMAILFIPDTSQELYINQDAQRPAISENPLEDA
jgi:hypothetical protein